VIEDWRIHYNAFRPHSSLGGLTPEAFAKKWQDENSNQNTQELSLEPVQLQG
jgi:putative transposase